MMLGRKRMGSFRGFGRQFTGNEYVLCISKKVKIETITKKEEQIFVPLF